LAAGGCSPGRRGGLGRARHGTAARARGAGLCGWARNRCGAVPAAAGFFRGGAERRGPGGAGRRACRDGGGGSCGHGRRRGAGVLPAGGRGPGLAGGTGLRGRRSAATPARHPWRTVASF